MVLLLSALGIVSNFILIDVILQKLKTRVVKKDVNPEWNEDLTLSISDSNVPVHLVSSLELPWSSSIYLFIVFPKLEPMIYMWQRMIIPMVSEALKRNLFLKRFNSFIDMWICLTSKGVIYVSTSLWSKGGSCLIEMVIWLLPWEREFCFVVSLFWELCIGDLIHNAFSN